MALLPNETIIMETEDWPHRVRLETQALGSAEVASNMLEEVASCAILRSCKRWLVAVAFIVLVIAAVSPSAGSGEYIVAFVIAAVVAIEYAMTRRTVLSVASAELRIVVQTRGMSDEMIRGFIEAVDAAKNTRFIQRSWPRAIATELFRTRR